MDKKQISDGELKIAIAKKINKAMKDALAKAEFRTGRYDDLVGDGLQEYIEKKVKSVLKEDWKTKVPVGKYGYCPKCKGELMKNQYTGKLWCAHCKKDYEKGIQKENFEASEGPIYETWEKLQKGGKAFCGQCGYDHRWSSGSKCPNCKGTGNPKWTEKSAKEHPELAKDFAVQESVKIKKSELKEYIDKQVNKLLEGYTHNSWSVLPIGNQNLESGDNKYFNIFDNWGNSQFTLVLVKRDGKYYGIWGSGDGGYAKAGEDKELEHDQTQKRMGRVQVVQEFIFKPKQLKEIAKQVIQKIGSKNLSSAVFK